MQLLTKFKLFLWYFAFFKVRLLGFVKPKLLAIDSEKIIVTIPLSSRTKNHLNSMYFGALAIGADLAGGMHGFYHADLLQKQISLAFKSFEANFIKRPETKVYFVGHDGLKIKNMLLESLKANERITRKITVDAYINFFNTPEKIADFTLELSIKVTGPK